MSHESPPGGGERETGRVEAFSDGVFAIAITLLVLEIRLEPEDFSHLFRALLDEWPAYLAYVTSFMTVGSVWIAHHRLFTRLRFVDPVLLRLNLLSMAVAFLPFPTAVPPNVPRVRKPSASWWRSAASSRSSPSCPGRLPFVTPIRDRSLPWPVVRRPVPAPPRERGWRASPPCSTPRRSSPDLRAPKLRPRATGGGRPGRPGRRRRRSMGLRWLRTK